MQHFDIIRRTQPKKSFRVANVIGTYDMQTSKIEEHFVGDLDLPEKWNIGLIVGRSGSGKTTIARELFGDYIIDKYDYTNDNILDDMPSGVPMTDIYKTLNSCGFSSPPSWLKPYSVLSNGEKMRCDIARACLEQRDMIVFDEFTSVVDRTVAQIGSFALQKAIRSNSKKFIAVTCHYDVQDWLMPDWVFNTDTMTFQSFSVEEQKKNRPSIELRIHEVSQAQDKERMWNVFRKYHYRITDSTRLQRCSSLMPTAHCAHFVPCCRSHTRQRKTRGVNTARSCCRITKASASGINCRIGWRNVSLMQGKRSSRPHRTHPCAWHARKTLHG